MENNYLLYKKIKNINKNILIHITINFVIYYHKYKIIIFIHYKHKLIQMMY